MHCDLCRVNCKSAGTKKVYESLEKTFRKLIPGDSAPEISSRLKKEMYRSTARQHRRQKMVNAVLWLSSQLPRASLFGQIRSTFRRIKRISAV